MPQLFQVLKCYKCSVFQVHQTKKSNKWQCKLCNEKQSIKRHYGIGTGKECRLHVQKLNGVRGELEELNESAELNITSDGELENISIENATEKRKMNCESKWSNFIDEAENSQKPEENESMYLGKTEVVLEIPVRKRKKFKAPTATVDSESKSYESNQQYNYVQSRYNYNEPMPRYELDKSVFEQQSSKQDLPASNDNSFFKTKSFNIHTQISKQNSMHPKIEEPSSVTKDLMQRHDLNKSSIKTYIPPKVNKNSKWAEFAEEPDPLPSFPLSREISLQNIVISQDNSIENVSLHKVNSEKINNLFSQCDESELDDVLEF